MSDIVVIVMTVLAFFFPGRLITAIREQDEEKAHIVLTMKAGRNEKENRARMQRRGMISSQLTFLPGQKVASSYVTMYGEIPVAVDTRRVEIRESEKGGDLLLDYDVYMGGERTSSARMEITWRV